MRLLKDSTQSNPSTLGQNIVVEALLSAAQIPPPACVALYGAWGTGKTSVLRALASQWNSSGRGPVVWFDPWEFERSGESLPALLWTMRSALQPQDHEKLQRFNDLFASALKTALSISLRLGMSAASYLALGPAAVALSPLSSIKPEDYRENFEVSKQAWEESVEAISKLKSLFRALVDEALAPYDQSARVLLVLDDLDRCLPDSAVKLIEEIKLVLCGDTACRAIFAFGLDRALIGESIMARYPGSRVYTGENYLEKIFDVALEVPQVPADRVEAFIENTCGKKLDAEFHKNLDSAKVSLAEITGVLGLPVFAVPRVMKRTLNRWMLLLSSAEHRAALTKITSPGDRRRFFCYVCGAERYRAFRDFVFTAAEDDLQCLALLGAEDGQAPPPRLTVAASAVASIPGFRSYATHLQLGARTAQSELTLSRDGTPRSLRDFDLLLRSAGV